MILSHILLINIYYNDRRIKIIFIDIKERIQLYTK